MSSTPDDEPIDLPDPPADSELDVHRVLQTLVPISVRYIDHLPNARRLFFGDLGEWISEDELAQVAPEPGTCCSPSTGCSTTASKTS